jgi:hypothetical protein
MRLTREETERAICRAIPVRTRVYEHRVLTRFVTLAIVLLVAGLIFCLI